MSFWQTKKLSEMNDEEWESLCDGCAKCCLHKLEDEDSGDIYFTSLACYLLDVKTCRCSQYAQRSKVVPECLNVRQLDYSHYHWLPSTCAYRLLHEGKELPAWHPLLTQDDTSVMAAGVSVSMYAKNADKNDDLTDLEDFIIEWLS